MVSKNFKMNKQLEKLMNKMEQIDDFSVLEFNIFELKNLFFPDFKKVFDCIIIAEESEIYLEEYYIKNKDYKNKTLYEAGNTETRINIFLENEKLTVYEGLKLATVLIEAWSNQLRLLDCSTAFCFIISCDNDNVEVRFHKVRVGESWLGENLEIYEDPAGYIIV